MEAGASEIDIFAEELIPDCSRPRTTPGRRQGIAVTKEPTSTSSSSRVERRNKLYSDNPPLLSIVLGKLRSAPRGRASSQRGRLELLRGVWPPQRTGFASTPARARRSAPRSRS